MRPAYRSVLGMLAIGLAVTFLYTIQTDQDIKADRQVQFTTLTSSILGALQESLRAYEMALRTGVGLLMTHPETNAVQWNQFVATLDINMYFPGLRSMGYIAAFPSSEAATILPSLAARAGSGFRIFPSCGDDICAPVLFVRRLDSGESQAVGFNLATEATRRDAILSARNTGRPAMTHRIGLLEQDKSMTRPGVLLLIPVRPQDDGTGGADTRPPTGFVYGALDAAEFATKAITSRDAQYLRLTDIRIYDSNGPGDRKILYDSNQGAASNPPVNKSGDLARQISLGMYGVTWTIAFTPTPQFEDTIDHWRLWFTALVGLLFTLAATFITAAIVRQREVQKEVTQTLTRQVEERRRAEQNLEVALRELGHRVKNTLTIVTSIASQTIRHSDSLADFEKAFRRRLQGLGEVHDLLTSSNKYDTDLKTLITKIVAPYASENEARFLTEGDAIVLNSDTAILLSILFNEFATNALKYGALSAANGMIAVKWHCEPTDGGEMLKLVWEEMNGPVVVSPTRTGFGSNVIKFVVERSLHGHTKVDYRPDGVAYAIELPWKDQKTNNPLI